MAHGAWYMAHGARHMVHGGACPVGLRSGLPKRLPPGSSCGHLTVQPVLWHRGGGGVAAPVHLKWCVGAAAHRNGAVGQRCDCSVLSAVLLLRMRRKMRSVPNTPPH
eukprot:176728-Chlamydomonas_euryale.AAC.1